MRVALSTHAMGHTWLFADVRRLHPLLSYADGAVGQTLVKTVNCWLLGVLLTRSRSHGEVS